MLGNFSMIDLQDGAVRRAAIGGCVQVDGYDLQRLTDGVAFEENGVNIEATSYDPPPPSDPTVGLEL